MRRGASTNHNEPRLIKITSINRDWQYRGTTPVSWFQNLLDWVNTLNSTKIQNHNYDGIYQIKIKNWGFIIFKLKKMTLSLKSLGLDFNPNLTKPCPKLGSMTQFDRREVPVRIISPESWFMAIVVNKRRLICMVSLRRRLGPFCQSDQVRKRPKLPVKNDHNSLSISNRNGQSTVLASYSGRPGIPWHTTLIRIASF